MIYGHRDLDFHLTQVFSRHRCFNNFLYNIKRVPSPRCEHCAQEKADNAEHTLFRYLEWSPQHDRLLASLALDRDGFTPDTLVPLMLLSLMLWKVVQEFANDIMLRKEDAKHKR